MPTMYWDKLETKKPTVESGFLKWCLQESNQGHMDFQSIALPTELRHLLALNAVANIMEF